MGHKLTPPHALGSPGGVLTWPSEASPRRFPAPVPPFVRRGHGLQLTSPAPLVLPSKIILVEELPHVRADDLPTVAGPSNKSRPRRTGVARRLSQ
jgi:hypothetical protein